MTKMMMLKYF